jgi:hypothetical protein
MDHQGAERGWKVRATLLSPGGQMPLSLALAIGVLECGCGCGCGCGCAGGGRGRRAEMCTTRARETDLLGPGSRRLASGAGVRRGGLQMRDGLEELSGRSGRNTEVERRHVLMDWVVGDWLRGQCFFRRLRFMKEMGLGRWSYQAGLLAGCGLGPCWAGAGRQTGGQAGGQAEGVQQRSAERRMRE